MRAIFVISFFAFMMQVAGAQTPAPFPEFTFKRVTPPTGSGPRINVQIAPFVAPGLPEITAAAPVEPLRDRRLDLYRTRWTDGG